MNVANSTTKRTVALVGACALVVAALSIAPVGVAVQNDSTEHEPNDQPANATHIEEGVVVTGEVNELPRDRVDVYAFEAKAGQRIVVNVTGLENGTQLTPSLSGPASMRGDSMLDQIYATLGTTTNRLGATAPVTGTYYITISNEAAMGPSGRYAVSVEVSGPTDTTEPNEKMATATPLTPPSTVKAAVTFHDSDVYAFEAAAGETITVEFTRSGGTGDVGVVLRDSAGDSFTYEYMESNETVTLTAPANATGTYYVVTGFPTPSLLPTPPDGTGPYTLRVSVSGSANTQAGPTEINSCTVIDESGRYVLTEDIENTTVDQCIEIKSTDGVVLDGAGHTIDGVDDFPTSGIVVFGRSGATNVTVTDVTVTDWGTGITYEATTGVIRDSVVASNSRGVSLTYGTSGVTVSNTTARNNDVDGFYVQDASGNRFVDVDASNNGRWDYSSVSDPRTGLSDANTVETLTLDSATVSFESRAIELRGIASPPPVQTDRRNVGGYVNASATGEAAFLDLSVHYADADAADVDEDSLRLYAFTDGKWTTVSGSTVDAEANVVSANITEFGDATVFAPLGMPEGEAPASEGESDGQPSKTREQLPNTITIESTADERVHYEFTASGRVEPGPRANLVEAEIPDEIDGHTASGSAALRGVDDYTFAGEITALSLDGGDAQVSINGEPVDPADFQSSTPTATPVPTTTVTPTTTATPTLTATQTPTTPTSTPGSSASTSTPHPTVTTATPIATPTGTPTSLRSTTKIAGTTTVTGTTAIGQPPTSPATDGTGEQTDAFGPGFGSVVAVVALLAISLYATRRQI